MNKHLSDRIVNNLRAILIAILASALIFCAIMMVRSYRTETEGADIYEAAADEFLSTLPLEAATPSPTTVPATEAPEDDTTMPTAPAGSTTEAITTAPPVTRPVIYSAESVVVDFEKLRAVNPDVVGWIIIENTTVSYPVLQGRDNEYYLNRTYNNRSSSYGSIFVDYRQSTSFNIDHTVIYGHNMRNSSMFGQLLKYSGRAFWEARPCFHILLPEGMLKYEIFSAYKAEVGSETYRVGFADDAAKQMWLDTVTGWSDVTMGVHPDVDDDIVTLSTCTSSSAERDDFRYVVHARKVMDTRGAADAEERAQ